MKYFFFFFISSPRNEFRNYSLKFSGKFDSAKGSEAGTGNPDATLQ